MPAPVKHTCPDIDRLKTDILEAYKELQHAIKMCNDLETDVDQRRVDNNQIYDVLVDIRYCMDIVDNALYSAPDILEELRNDNWTLRSWGEEMEDKVKELEDEIYRTQ